MRVDTVTMVLVGIAAWVVALVVVLILRAGGSPLDDQALICVAGIGFGILALGWAVPQQRRARRREAQRAGQGDAGPGADGTGADAGGTTAP